MKTVGIIGGIGPESTVVYYRGIISSFRDRDQTSSYPRILINSIDMTKMLGLIGSGELIAVTRYLSDAVMSLADAGADFALLASNTPHIVFDDVENSSPIPLLSIVKETCKTAQTMGLHRLGLFGTRFTMSSSFYPNVFTRQNITVVSPTPEDQNYIHEKYMGELVNGVVKKETKIKLLDIAEKLKHTHDIQGLILGGTELSLILDESDGKTIPLLDTTRIHIARIVDRLFDET